MNARAVLSMSSARLRPGTVGVALALAAFALAACGRADHYERPLSAGRAVALDQVVAWPLAGPPALAVHAPARDATAFFGLEAPAVAVAATHGRDALVAVDENGRATVLRFADDGARAAERGREDVDLGAAFSVVQITPDDRFAVFRHGERGGGAVIRNANEIAVLDLSRPTGPENPQRRTLKSFGAGLRTLVLPPPGSIAGGDRHLAFALSDRYLAIFDLALPEADEVVVHFTLEGETRDVVPVSVVPVPGGGGEAPGALVRALGSDDLYLLSFPAEASATAVPRPTLNVLPGGPLLVDAITHRTPDGLRVFTLGGSFLSVVHPVTGARRAVGLSFFADAILPFEAEDGAPSAVLWGRGASQVAYVRLDELESAGSRAVRTLTLEGGLSGLVPIPGRAVAVGLQPARMVVLDFPAETATPYDLGGMILGEASGAYWDADELETGGEAAVVTDGTSAFAVMLSDDGQTYHIVRVDVGGAAGAVATAIPLRTAGRPIVVPGAGRLVIDHGTTAGTISVVATDAAPDARADVRRSIFLTEVLDR